ncbi:hypothetical protein AAYR20_18450 [Providencia stuartii]
MSTVLHQPAATSQKVLSEVQRGDLQHTCFSGHRKPQLFSLRAE